MSSVFSLDIPKPAPATAAAPAFSSTPAANSQDMFDDAFGAPNSSPFGAPPVAMVQTIHTDTYNVYHTPSVTVFICNFFLTLQQTATAGQTAGSTAAFGDPFGNPFA